MENSLSLQICRKEKSLLLLQHLFVSFSFPLPPVTDDSGLLVHCISGWDRTPLFISLLRLSLWAVSTCLTCSASGGGCSEGERLCHQKVVLEHLMFLLLILPSEGMWIGFKVEPNVLSCRQAQHHRQLEQGACSSAQGILCPVGCKDAQGLELVFCNQEGVQLVLEAEQALGTSVHRASSL